MPQPKKHETNALRQVAYRKRRFALARSQPVAGQGPRQARLLRVPAKPGARRWEALLHQAQAVVEATADEMQDYYDERSEKWQEDERGEAFMERLEAVQEITAALDQLP